MIGVPLFAVIYDILRKLIFRGLHRNQCDDMLSRYHQLYGDLAADAAAEAARTEAEQQAP